MVDTHLDPQLVSDWMRSAKTALEVLKGARDLLPKGPERSKVEAAVTEAESAAARADATLAKALGYQLCTCTFPPSIMLWQQAAGQHACPSAACGRTVKPRPTAPGSLCPRCGETELRATTSEPMKGRLGEMGARLITYVCECGFSDVRNK